MKSSVFHWGPNSLWHTVGMPKWVWPSMNRCRLFFVQTSTLPSRMHHKRTEHGRCYMQNNQLLTKVMFCIFTHIWSEVWNQPYDIVLNNMQGVVASGAVLYLQCWSNQKAGPLFVAAYAPIQPIFATIFGFYFLGEALYLGRYGVLQFLFFW